MREAQDPTIYPDQQWRTLDDLREERGCSASLRLLREVDDLYVLADVEVPGEPVSKARAKFDRRKNKAYNPEKNEIAETQIGWLFRQVIGPIPSNGNDSFGVFATFFVGTRTRRDVDNMLKLVMDALTGVVWKDDSQVSEVSGKIIKNDVGPPRSEIVVYYTYRNLVPAKLCELCGESYRVFASMKHTRFCSDACSRKSRRTATKHACKCCGTILTLTPTQINAGIVHCSRECREKMSSYTFAHCKQCGEQVKQTYSAALRNPSALCSRDCRIAYWKSQPLSPSAKKGCCDHCGGPTSRPAYTRCKGCKSVGAGGK